MDFDGEPGPGPGQDLIQSLQQATPGPLAPFAGWLYDERGQRVEAESGEQCYLCNCTREVNQYFPTQLNLILKELRGRCSLRDLYGAMEIYYRVKIQPRTQYPCSAAMFYEHVNLHVAHPEATARADLISVRELIELHRRLAGGWTDDGPQLPHKDVIQNLAKLVELSIKLADRVALVSK